MHENLPEFFSPKLSDYDIIAHNVGFRTGRSSGIRIEKEVKDGQRIVHAYGKTRQFGKFFFANC